MILVRCSLMQSYILGFYSSIFPQEVFFWPSLNALGLNRLQPGRSGDSGSHGKEIVAIWRDVLGRHSSICATCVWPRCSFLELLRQVAASIWQIISAICQRCMCRGKAIAQDCRPHTATASGDWRMGPGGEFSLEPSETKQISANAFSWWKACVVLECAGHSCSMSLSFFLWRWRPSETRSDFIRPMEVWEWIQDSMGGQFVEEPRFVSESRPAPHLAGQVVAGFVELERSQPEPWNRSSFRWVSHIQ